MADNDDRSQDEAPQGDPAEEPKGRGRGPNDAGEDWDDWDDDWAQRNPSGGGGTDTKLIAVIVIAVVAIIAVILFTRKGDDDKDSAPPQQQPGNTEQTDGGGFCGDWPAELGGSGQNVGAEGVHVWSDFEGIHVRASGGEPTTVKVTGDASYKVKSPGTGVTASATEGAEVTFELPAGDGSAGPDLDVSCEVGSLTIEATRGGAPVAPEQIHVGDSAKAPENPATYERDE